MSILGIGPLLLLVGALATFLVIALKWAAGIALALPAPYDAWARAVGVLVICVGVVFWFSGGVLVRRGYTGHRLVTSGVYRVSRNPMYTGIMLFIIPGLALVLNELLLLGIPVAMMATFKGLIGREEEYLAKEFGAAYEEYRRTVGQLLPWRRRAERIHTHAEEV